MPDIFVSDKNKETEHETEKPKSTAMASGKASVEPRGGSLSSFISYPESVRFDTQEEQEQIILLLRKHWITNLGWVMIAILLLIIPVFLFPLLFTHGILPLIPANFSFIGILIWYLITFGFVLVNFISWYFNVYIVTNERIIDVDFLQLLYKQMASTRVSRVQDLTYKLGGVIQSIFDFGDVFIQTAGEEPNFDFNAVPHPEQVVRTISELTEKEEHPV